MYLASNQGDMIAHVGTNIVNRVMHHQTISNHLSVKYIITTNYETVVLKFSVFLSSLLFTVTLHATPITSLTAGAFTFSNIACQIEDLPGTPAPGCSAITATAGVATTGPYAGYSFTSFSDNGYVVPAPVFGGGGLAFDYTVTYSGTADDYLGYVQGGHYFLGGTTFLITGNGADFRELIGYFNTFNVDDEVLYTPATAPAGVQTITYYYGPNPLPVPEQSSLLLAGTGSLFLLARLVRRRMTIH